MTSKNNKFKHSKLKIGWGLILIYNAFIATALIFLFPVLLALIQTSEKRRYTFRQRMGWCNYPWEKIDVKEKCERIWIHALSVGEVQSAHVLTSRIRALKPDAEIFFTASTLTGFQTAQRIFGNEAIHLGYFPYDCIWAVRKIISMIRPTRVIITETDLWPVFLWEIKQRKVPVNLVNLRLSDRTWRTYNRFKGLVGLFYAAFDRVCVQTPKEMDYLAELGISSDHICITGNLKFDNMVPASTSLPKTIRDLNIDIPKGHRIIVAGSTHDGEEEIIFDTLKHLLSLHKDVSLILAPRDPGRSRQLRSLCRKYRFNCGLLSDVKNKDGFNFPDVLIVDTIGLLKDLYCLADLSIVGGSLVPLGGHNPLEPACWGKPVLFGPDMSDFGLIAQYLIKGGGALKVDNERDLTSAVIQLLDHPEISADMGKNALKILQAHRGSVDRTLSGINMSS